MTMCSFLMYSIYISYRSFYRFVSLSLSSPWEKLSVLLVLSEDQKYNYFGNSIYGHLFLKFSYNLNNMMVIYLMWIVFLVATAGRVRMRDFHQYMPYKRWFSEVFSKDWYPGALSISLIHVLLYQINNFRGR